MRSDMHKVIVERERSGSYDSYHSRRHVDRGYMLTVDDDGHLDCEAPTKTSMKSTLRETRFEKMLSENLSPLLRWLHKQVGHRWDDVYADVCKNLSKDTGVQLHVFEHLLSWVERAPMKIEKGGFITDQYGWEMTYIKNVFYVDNRGVLRRAPMKPQVAIKREPCFVQLTDAKDRCLVKLGGIWYEMGLIDRPKELFDQFGRILIDADLKICTVKGFPRNKLAISPKKQLSSRELRRRGLSNDV